MQVDNHGQVVLAARSVRILQMRIATMSPRGLGVRPGPGPSGRPGPGPSGRPGRGLGFVVVALLVAACGTTQPSTAAQQSGLTSIALPATASPTIGASASDGPSGGDPSSSLSANSSPANSSPGNSSPGTTPTATPTPIALHTPLPSVKIKLVLVAGGLAGSIGIANAGDARLFVIEQSGRIVILNGSTVAGSFLDISAKISCCGERGLLGLAFHPHYASDGRFYVRYTNTAGNVVISEFHVSSNPNKADAASERILLTFPHPTYANHNGGRIEFVAEPLALPSQVFAEWDRPPHHENRRRCRGS